MSSLPGYLLMYAGFWVLKVTVNVIFPFIEEYDETVIKLVGGGDYVIYEQIYSQFAEQFADSKNEETHAAAPDAEELEVQEVKLSLIDYISEDYKDWVVGDRIIVPQKLGEGHHLYDVFAPRVSWSDIKLYISYEVGYVPRDGSIAKALFEQLYLHNEDHYPSEKVFQPDVYTIEWDTVNHRFRYPNGVEAIMLPGSIITMNFDASLHQTSREIKYYKHTQLPTARVGSPDLNFTREEVYDQQIKNFAKFFWGYENVVGIDVDGYVEIQINESLPFNRLIKDNDVTGILGLKTLGIKKKDGTLRKLIWFEDIGSYLDAATREEYMLENGDRLYQLVLDDVRDVDGLVSIEYIIYDNEATGCTKTKRLNGYQFDIRMPFGSGPYATARQPRGGPTYIGQSKNDFKNVKRYMATRDTREWLLDPESFPEDTNIVEVIFHSDSFLGQIYGHAAIIYKWNDNRWVLDPYVDVPGYDQREPKLLEDYMDSQRVQRYLGLARVFYWKSPVEVTGVSMEQFAKFAK